MPAKPKPAKKATKPVKSSASKAPPKPVKKAVPKPQAKASAKKSSVKKPAPKVAKPAAKAKPAPKQVVKSQVKSKTAKAKPAAKVTPSAKASSKGKAPTKKPVANVKKSPPKKTAPAKSAKSTAKPAAKVTKPAAKPSKAETKPAAPAKKETAKPMAPAKAPEAPAKKAAPEPAPAPKSSAKETKKSSGGVAPPLSKNFNAGPPIKSVSRTVQEEVGATIDVPRVVKVTPLLKKQKQRLIELRSMLLDQMDSVAEGSLRVRPEGSEASAFGMHQADAGSDAYDRDFALSLLSQEQDSLYEINEALKRIELGTYGICEMSGKQIPEIRLEALPFTRFTVECQAQLERQNMGGRFRRPVRSLFGLDEAADEGGDDSDEETETVDKNAE